MKRNLIALLISLSLSIACWPQTSRIGVAITGADYDSNKGVTTIHLVNISKKEVSAFSLTFRAVLPDGTSTPSSRLLVDLLGAVTHGEGGILPGGSYEQTIFGQPGL